MANAHLCIKDIFKCFTWNEATLVDELPPKHNPRKSHLTCQMKLVPDKSCKHHKLLVMPGFKELSYNYLMKEVTQYKHYLRKCTIFIIACDETMALKVLKHHQCY